MNGRGNKLQPNLTEEELERQKKQEEYKEELAKVTSTLFLNSIDFKQVNSTKKSRFKKTLPH